MSRGFYALNFFSPAFVDQLKRGRKTATIRLGDKSRKYERGQLVWITIGHQHSPREKIFTAVIDDVEVKRARELSPRDIEHDNPEFRRLEETLSFMRQIYGREIDPEDTVTVIRFSQVVEPPPAQFGNGETPSRATRRRMPMAEYRFLTTWLLESPREPVWDAIYDSERWPTWWRGVDRRGRARPRRRDRRRLALARYTWRSKLPYDLVFEAKTRTVEKPRLLEADAFGELAGRRALAPVRAGRGDRCPLRVERAHDQGAG